MDEMLAFSRPVPTMINASEKYMTCSDPRSRVTVPTASDVAAATSDAVGTVTRDLGSLQVMYFSLALIIVGTGLLKANISSIVGSLYDEGDRRRDGGFTIFYMGIKIGAALAPLLCGWLGETYGW